MRPQLRTRKYWFVDDSTTSLVQGQHAKQTCYRGQISNSHILTCFLNHASDKANSEGQETSDRSRGDPEAGKECPALAGAQLQNYSPTQAADVEVKIHSERQQTPTGDANSRTDEAVKLTVEETVTEECCVSAETGTVKKRKLEETSEPVKKSRASVEVTDVTQPESQTDRQLAEPEDSQSQQLVKGRLRMPSRVNHCFQCYAQDTMNELLGMFGYDGVDEEEASNLHLPGETQAYCSTECVTQGKSAYISNTAAGSHRLQTKKKGKYSAQDAMNELIGMYMCDGGEEDETSNLQKISRLSSSSPGVLNHNPSPTEQEIIADTAEGCMLCKVKTKALDFVLKLPDGTHQAYCSGLCLARGKALMKKMSSRSSRPFSSHRLHNRNKERSSTQAGNKAAHKQQCAGSSHQTKLEIKQKKLTRSRALKPAETQEDEEKPGICQMGNSIPTVVLNVCQKGKKSRQEEETVVPRLSLSAAPRTRRFLQETATKCSAKTRCKKTISGDRIISTDGGKFCSEICVRRHKIMLQ
ncbi:hypothetical protein Bbelb_193760 [Branchiostoma belcheri]|nr:hypothetical protein Bbelb_193760 [Branchiostoma belcheri]